jgi:hypothetical protein
MAVRIKRLNLAVIAGLSICIGLAVQAALVTDESMPKAPIYRPLEPNGLKKRIDGHVRGTDDAILTLTVLAPEDIGRTTKAQPCLYWFQSKSVRNQCELTITQKGVVQPLLDAKFEGMADGIQRLRLSDYQITLVEGVEYRWSVAMVVDAENRSSDVVASGAIMRVKPTEKLLARLKDAPASELPYIYADEGIWYDSLETLSQLVATRPQDVKLHQIRAVYFMQVGLHDAALHEMRFAGQTAGTPVTGAEHSP